MNRINGTFIQPNQIKTLQNNHFIQTKNVEKKHQSPNENQNDIPIEIKFKTEQAIKHNEIDDMSKLLKV